MKTVVRILILAEFAAIVFIPSAYLPRWALIPMFASMVGLVVLYWFAMFWVSRKDVIRVLGKEPEHDFYVGKLPADPNADLTRGRLCVTGGRLVLMQRTDEKEHRQTPCREAWSRDIDEVTSIGFGKVLPARKGFILYFGEDEVRFTCSRAAKDRAMIYNALGWPVPESAGSN
jgi:hypothetical protein